MSQIHGFGVFLNNVVPGHVIRAYMMTTTKAEIIKIFKYGGIKNSPHIKMGAVEIHTKADFGFK